MDLKTLESFNPRIVPYEEPYVISCFIISTPKGTVDLATSVYDTISYKTKKSYLECDCCNVGNQTVYHYHCIDNTDFVIKDNAVYHTDASHDYLDDECMICMSCLEILKLVEDTMSLIDYKLIQVSHKLVPTMVMNGTYRLIRGGITSGLLCKSIDGISDKKRYNIHKLMLLKIHVSPTPMRDVFTQIVTLFISLFYTRNI